MTEYNFAYLDEQTKRMIRRAILKGLAIPGYQVPFASREMPMPYGWGTGGVQVTAAILTPGDTFKVIDQGADDTTNAVSIRRFFEKTAGVDVTEVTSQATVIQTRHRIPEEPLTEDQILVYQVPIPEPLRFLEPSEVETRKMHSLEEYGLMHVKLYEDISQHGAISTAYAYPVRVEGRYVMDPSPIPKFDNPKLEMSAIQLFGAGREQRIYALPPYTQVVSLDFEDHPFEPTKADLDCDLCGSNDSYLDELIVDDDGGRLFMCSDTDYCSTRRADGHIGLTVADLNASANFFTGALGWKVFGGNPDYPSVYVTNGHLKLTLWQRKSASPRGFDRHAQTGLHHFALKVSDRDGLDAVFGCVADWPGVVVEFSPELSGKGPKIHFMITEPGGNRMEFAYDPR
jgi:alpha-D-ribose 1-methylphosphonate 5-phosphate C-P lyase